MTDSCKGCQRAKAISYGGNGITIAVVIGLASLVYQQMGHLRTEIQEHKAIQWHAGAAESIPTLQAQVQAGTGDRFRGSDWEREQRSLDRRLDEIRGDILSHEKDIAIIRERVTRLETHPVPSR